MLTAIVANIIIFLLRLRIAGSILPIFTHKKAIIITSIIGAMLGGTALRFTPQIIPGAFTTSIGLSSLITRSIIGILAIISLITTPSQRKKLIQTTIVIALVNGAGLLLTSSSTAHFFITIVTIEERIKYAITQNNHSRWSIETHDIVIFALIAGLSYARRENILVATNLSTTIARSTTYLAHSIFATVLVTGFLSKKLLRPALISITLALSLHLGYNLADGHLHRTIWIMAIVARYGLISYTLSQSDSIYLLRRNALAKTTTHH